MIAIDAIIWPADAREACRSYLGFLIKITEEMELTFPDWAPNPVVTAKAFVAGEIPEERYRSETNRWWDHIDSSGGMREFRDPSILSARLALCLLSATEDEAGRLGEHLSWFLEVLGFMGVDLEAPVAEMERYFQFQKQRGVGDSMQAASSEKCPCATGGRGRTTSDRFILGQGAS